MFVVSFICYDDVTIGIYELTSKVFFISIFFIFKISRNSGIIGGKFLERRRIQKKKGDGSSYESSKLFCSRCNSK